MMRLYPLPGDTGVVAQFLAKAENAVREKWQKEIDAVCISLDKGEFISFQGQAKSYYDEAEALMKRAFGSAVAQEDKKEHYTKIYVAFQMSKNYLTFYAEKLHFFASRYPDRYPRYDRTLVDSAYAEASRIQERINALISMVHVEFDPKFRTPPPDHPKPPPHFSRRY